MKKVIVVIFVFSVIFGIVIGAYTLLKSEKKEDINDKYRAEGWWPGEYEAYYIREKMPADILWIGTYSGYDFDIPIRIEQTVDRKTINPRTGFNRIIIVVNDLDGKVNLNDNEYEMIVDRVINDSRYMFFYLGTKKLLSLVEAAGFNTDSITKNELSVFLTHNNNEIVFWHGTYDEQDLKNEINPCFTVLSGYEGTNTVR